MKKKPQGCAKWPHRPDISYPCSWEYKVIGSDPALLQTVIREACAPADPEITVSNTSSTGRYLSLNARLTVDTEEMRLRILSRIQNHHAVKLVI